MESVPRAVATGLPRIPRIDIANIVNGRYRFPVLTTFPKLVL